MKKLIIALTLLTSMKAFSSANRGAIEITIENNQFELLKNDNNKEIIDYVSKSSCLEMQSGHHSPFSFPGRKEYSVYPAFEAGNIMNVDYKGKKSICKYRSTSVQFSFGPVVRNQDDNIRHWRELIRIRHDEKSSDNRISLVCGRFTTNYSDYEPVTDFKCKVKGKKKYPSGLVKYSANLSEDISINIEIDPESESF
jgi:hypothetical protein